MHTLPMNPSRQFLLRIATYLCLLPATSYSYKFQSFDNSLFDVGGSISVVSKKFTGDGVADDFDEDRSLDKLNLYADYRLFPSLSSEFGARIDLDVTDKVDDSGTEDESDSTLTQAYLVAGYDTYMLRIGRELPASSGFSQLNRSYTDRSLNGFSDARLEFLTDTPEISMSLSRQHSEWGIRFQHDISEHSPEKVSIDYELSGDWVVNNDSGHPFYLSAAYRSVSTINWDEFVSYGVEALFQLLNRIQFGLAYSKNEIGDYIEANVVYSKNPKTDLSVGYIDFSNNGKDTESHSSKVHHPDASQWYLSVSHNLFNSEHLHVFAEYNRLRYSDESYNLGVVGLSFNF